MDNKWKAQEKKGSSPVIFFSNFVIPYKKVPVG